MSTQVLVFGKEELDLFNQFKDHRGHFLRYLEDIERFKTSVPNRMPRASMEPFRFARLPRSMRTNKVSIKCLKSEAYSREETYCGIPLDILFDELLLIRRLNLDHTAVDIKKAYAVPTELQ